MLAPCKKSYDKPRQCIKKQRLILSTKVRLAKAMVFPVVMYGCESWTTKKAPEDGEGQGSQACCSPWDCNEVDMTDRLNSNNDKGNGVSPLKLAQLFPFTSITQVT